ncbi:MAG TPA: 3-deoxy-D-manno-octulosonic acid kinase [Succinivibrionaceae bacterium]|nr:3-deoxy-D-manno-octulosonic acid kinase [Succinivibrio sp.]HAR80049.1 3-deoxy-D-manno-octulosonic acid kinase [Succinivibrionaceae bacterium]
MNDAVHFFDGLYSYLITPELQPDNNIEAELLHSYFDRDYIEKHCKDVQIKGGRGKAILFDRAGQKLVLRHYYRGGLFGRVAKDLFFNKEPLCRRSFAEFELLTRLRRMNLPVPKPLIARVEEGRFCIKNDIVIGQIEKSFNLAEIIAHRALETEELFRIGATIKRFFDSGVDHTDLNIRNILLNAEGEVFIIDFDKCFIRDSLSRSRKKSIVERLHRSFKKEVQNSRIQLYFDDADFSKLSDEALD